MLVTLPLYLELLNGSQSVESVHALYEKHYADQPFIRVMPLGAESETGGFLAGNSVSGWDGLRIYVSGNEERIQVASQFDNLGKGASGAAVECLNLVLGCDPAKGLNL